MTAVSATDPAAATRALAPRVRAHLRAVAARATPITYQALAQALALAPPRTIHRVAIALEHLMQEDAANGHPFIAALVVSKARGGLPAPGFFDAARRLGRFGGADASASASAFHAAAFAAAVEFWRSPDGPEADDAA